MSAVVFKVRSLLIHLLKRMHFEHHLHSYLVAFNREQYLFCGHGTLVYYVTNVGALVHVSVTLMLLLIYANASSASSDIRIRVTLVDVHSIISKRHHFQLKLNYMEICFS